MILKTQSKMNWRKKTMMMKKNKRIKIMNNEKDFWDGISCVSKSLRLGNRENSEEETAIRDQATCFKGNSNSQYRVIVCAFLRYHLKRIPDVQQSCSGCLIEKYRYRSLANPYRLTI